MLHVAALPLIGGKTIRDLLLLEVVESAGRREVLVLVKRQLVPSAGGGARGEEAAPVFGFWV